MPWRRVLQLDKLASCMKNGLNYEMVACAVLWSMCHCNNIKHPDHTAYHSFCLCMILLIVCTPCQDNCIKVVVIWNIIPCSWAPVYQTRWYYIPEIHNPVTHFHEDLTSRWTLYLSVIFCSLLYKDISWLHHFRGIFFATFWLRNYVN